MRPRVLVVGGAGYFGRLLVRELLSELDCAVVVGGRRREPFDALSASLGERAERVAFRPIDLGDPGRVRNALSDASLAICAAGPFQDLPTSLAEACQETDVPYLDLADDRAFVARARALARPGGPSFFPGCSTAPALSAALCAVAAEGREGLGTIRVFLAAGNAVCRQAGAIESLLSSVGKPLVLLDGAGRRTARGWTEPASFPFPPPIGPLEGRLVDVPDHDLLPALFRARSAEFRVAPEFTALGDALSAMAELSHLGLLGDMRQWTPDLLRCLETVSPLGGDWGALGVEAGRRVCLVADRQGPAMAVMPAVIMARRILQGQAPRGLVALESWLPRAELERECAFRGLRLVVDAG